jgi:hypothetical protein
MNCKQKKRDGEQCRAPRLAGKDYCAMHSQPGRAAALGSKGGRQRAMHARSELKEFAAPQSAADLRDLLAESIVEIRSGTLEPKIANALGYLGASYLRAIEVSDIERRIGLLESAHQADERSFLGSGRGHGSQEVELGPVINSGAVGEVGK